MNQIERIQKMEEYLNEAEGAVKAFSEAIGRVSAARAGIEELEAYLGSEEWCRDREDDEAGRLPQDLRRGVLSEDGIYNVIMENRQNMRDALMLAAEVM